MKTKLFEHFQKQSLRALFLALSLLSTSLFAHAFYVDGIYYLINGTDATVTNGSSSGGYSGDVVIPSTVTYNGVTYPVTSIGYEAFYCSRNLTSVTIPNSVTSIDNNAFKTCTSLTSVTIPNSVTSIGWWAFADCNSLTSVTISNAVTTISEALFSGCSSLSSVIIPNSVTYIKDHAFNKCSSLTSVTIGNSVTSIGRYAFSGCSRLPSVTIPNSVVSIGASAFRDCSALETLNYNAIDCVYGTEYDGFIFKNTNISTINIGDEVKCIPTDFANGFIRLTNITIPSSVTSIGGSAFRGCSSLTSVNIPNSVTSIGGSAFSGCSSLTSVNIPNSVTSIGGSAFSGCSSLTSVNIPNSVVSIGESAFSGCSSLTSVNIPNSVTSIGGSAFSSCSSMTSVTIPNSVSSISSYAFSGCTRLTSVIIPNSITTIGESAFSGCISLPIVTIPSSVNTVCNNAFDGCAGLTRINITDIEAWCRISFYNYTSNPLIFAHHLYLNGSEVINLVIPNPITSVSNYAFAYCTNLLSVKLPKTLKSIGEYAFQGCTGLTSITIPESVTTIGNNAFSGCTGLNNVNIPNSVTTIGYNAFRSCTGLKSATITSHLTSLGEYAFSGCSALSSFTCMPDTPPIFNSRYSFDTYNTTSLYVPRSGVENYKTHTNWRRFSKIYEFVGYFTVPDVNVSKGKTVVVPVSMTNEADIIGFQTDIYLPEGFEFVKDGNDYVVDPSDRLARDHSIMCNVSEDGALRVLCYSPTNKVISGNEGELFYVTIKAPNDTVGDFSLWFKNTILTTSDTEELLSPDASTNLNVIPYLPGDVNGNGEISVIDIVTAAQYIIFQNPDPFLFEAADLNNDEQITVTDLALIANLILYPTMNAPKRVPSIDLSEDQIHGNDIHLNAGETRTVNMTLDNSEKYSAFQMDLKLPDGLTASNFKMTNQTDRHCFITSEEKDGILRVLCYSPSLTALGNDDKSLLTFDVTSIGKIVGDIIINGIELVTTSCQPVHLNALAIGVNQTNTVNEVPNGKIVTRTDYYNLAGQKQAEPAKGVTIIVTTYTDGSRSTQKVIL